MTTAGRFRRMPLFPLVLLLAASLLFTGDSSCGYAGVAVIGHAGLGPLDTTVTGRIFTGRTVQVAGTAVQPVNLKAGNATRVAFLRAVLQQSDEDYIAYWIVRRAIGKGAPPPEVENFRDMIDFVRTTPGAIGYVDDRAITPGMNVLLTLP